MTPPEVREPERFVRLIHALAEAPASRATLVEIADALLEAVDGERVFLFRLRSTGGFRVLAARNRDAEDLSNPARRISHYAVGRMLAGAGTWRIGDARQDRRYRTEDALDGARSPRSILIFPVSAREEIVGGIYVDHRFRELDPALAESAATRTWVALCSLAMRLREEQGRLRVLEKSVGARTAGLAAPAPASGRQRRRLGPDTRRDLEELHGLESANPDMLDLFDAVRSLASTDIPVLIHGETGSGKSLLAKAVHLCSKRSGGAFVTLSCGSVPDSLLESELLGHVRGAFTGADGDRVGLLVQASGGTLFLDEVGDISLEAQTKLLRVLEDRRVRPLGAKDPVPVDVRLVAATSTDLEVLVSRGRFRGDLFFRLRGTLLEIPPLRERWEDIPGLVESILRQALPDGSALRVQEEVLERFMEYSWPGNVRELENELRRLAALGVEEVTLEQLSPAFARRRSSSAALDGRAFEPLDDVVTSAERQAIEAALRLCGGKNSKAA